MTRTMYPYPDDDEEDKRAREREEEEETRHAKDDDADKANSQEEEREEEGENERESPTEPDPAFDDKASRNSTHDDQLDQSIFLWRSHQVSNTELIEGLVEKAKRLESEYINTVQAIEDCKRMNLVADFKIASISKELRDLSAEASGYVDEIEPEKFESPFMAAYDFDESFAAIITAMNEKEFHEALQDLDDHTDERQLLDEDQEYDFGRSEDNAGHGLSIVFGPPPAQISPEVASLIERGDFVDGIFSEQQYEENLDRLGNGDGDYEHRDGAEGQTRDDDDDEHSRGGR